MGYGGDPPPRVTLGLLLLPIGAVAAAVLLVLAVWSTRPAAAHGPAHWIASEPRYVDRAGTHCCGEADCWPVHPGAIGETAAGVSHGGQMLRWGERGIYWTAEPNPPAGMRPFVCVRHGVLRCIFRPQPGS